MPEALQHSRQLRSQIPNTGHLSQTNSSSRHRFLWPLLRLFLRWISCLLYFHCCIPVLVLLFLFSRSSVLLPSLFPIVGNNRLPQPRRPCNILPIESYEAHRGYLFSKDG